MRYLGSIKLTTTENQNLMGIIKSAEHSSHPEFKLDNPKTGLIIRELVILADSECEIIINKDSVIVPSKAKKFKLPIEHLEAKTAGVGLTLDYSYGDEYEFNNDYPCDSDFPNGDNESNGGGGSGTQGPKGDKGDKGVKGDTGATGPRGATGERGPQGSAGTVGAKGDTGAIGPKGETGAVGARGATGANGTNGAKGDKGDTGAQGPQGVPGPPGNGSGSTDLSDYYNKSEVDAKLSYSTTETGLFPVSTSDVLGTEFVNPIKTVDSNGNINISQNPAFGAAGTTGFIVTKGVDEMVFTADEVAHWVAISANDNFTQSVFIGIGGNFFNAAFVKTKGSEYVLDIYTSGYTKKEVNSSYSNLVVGDDIKVVNDNDRVTFHFKKPGSQDFAKWFHVLKNDIACRHAQATELGTDGHGKKRLGLFCGITGPDNANSARVIGKNVRINKTVGGEGTVKEKIAELDNKVNSLLGGETPTPTPTKKKKYAIVCVAGQSNAVGYDESPVDHRFTYAENNRVKQLGFKGEDNLKIVPLAHCAQNFQDMASFTNPANPERKGSKGIHLPLGNLLAKQIPSDYDILIIPNAFGDTGFTKGTNGTYDAANMKPMNGTGHSGIKWSSTSPYFSAMKDRIKFTLDNNEDNIFLGVVWVQGEADMTNAANHLAGFNTMTSAFFDYFNTNGYSNRVRKGTFDKDIWFNVETVNYWYSQGQCQTIWNNYKAWNGKTYVEVSRDTESNSTNGTGSTSSARGSHYGNNAFYKVVAPNVFNKMLSTNVLI